tara:strand:+ start:1727 stop:2398 length:672 start_codon:yes stop_codon:yes gene_type:complete
MDANRKRVQVHMLPTEDKSDIIENNSLDFIYHSSHKDYSHWGVEESEHLSYQHLYFTTDGIPNFKHPKYNVNGNKLEVWDADDMECLDLVSIKIIATTDPKLYLLEIDEVGIESKFSLPQPSQAFIKAYCEQGGIDGIDEVDVEYETGSSAISDYIQNKPVNHTLYRYLKVDPIHNTITTHRIVEKVYSREEVLFLLHNLCIHLQPTVQSHDLTEWVKENLKQ